MSGEAILHSSSGDDSGSASIRLQLSARTWRTTTRTSSSGGGQSKTSSGSASQKTSCTSPIDNNMESQSRSAPSFVMAFCGDTAGCSNGLKLLSQLASISAITENSGIDSRRNTTTKPSTSSSENNGLPSPVKQNKVQARESSCPQPKRKRRRQEPEHKTFVTAIRDEDVLFGRGSRTGAHPGNKVYLKQKDLMQSRYIATTRRDEKKVISQELVDFIHNRGGRFLKQEEDSSGSNEDRWYEVLDSTARDKASQALREINTPEVRRKKRLRYAKQDALESKKAAATVISEMYAKEEERQRKRAKCVSHELLEISPSAQSSNLEILPQPPQESNMSDHEEVASSSSSSSSSDGKPNWLLEIREASPPALSSSATSSPQAPKAAIGRTDDEMVQETIARSGKERNVSRKSRKLTVEPNQKNLVPASEVRNEDVLLGRGGKSGNHPGNKVYLMQKDLMQIRYRAAPSREEKKAISQGLVDFIHRRGGRFLKQDEGRADAWYVVPDNLARQKASQALRDVNTPEVRQQKRAKYAKKES